MTQLRFVGWMLVLATLGSMPTFGSCQTIYCHYRYAQSDIGLEPDPLADRNPANLREAYTPHGAFPDQSRSEKVVARWRERYNFEAEPRLVDFEADRRADRELGLWQRQARRHFPSDWVCRLDTSEDAEAELKMVEQLAVENPDSVSHARCFQMALVSLGRALEAVDAAEAFLVDHPEEQQAWDNLLGLLWQLGDESVERRQKLLEKQAAELPTLKNRMSLLRHYSQHRLIPLRDQLLQSLESEGLSRRERKSVCRAIYVAADRSNQKAEQDCWIRLYRQTQLEPGPEAEEFTLNLLRDLLSTARAGADWPLVELLLADWPAEDLPTAWREIKRGFPEKACAGWLSSVERFAEATSREDSPTGSWLVRTAADLSAECSREDLALRLLNGALPEPAADLDSARAAQQRLQSEEAYKGRQRQRYSYWDFTGTDPEVPIKERRRMAREWLEQSPYMVAPARTVIDIDRKIGLIDEAAEWLFAAAERYPENPEIPLAVGRAALWEERTDLMGKAAERIEQSKFANPRQRAEAAYLRGHVALAEGRNPEAGRRLAEYFVLRQRFEPCGHCDVGLVTLLAGNGDMETLESYLAARRVGIREFVERHYGDASPQNLQPQSHRFRPTEEEPWFYWLEDFSAGRCRIDVQPCEAQASSNLPVCQWMACQDIKELLNLRYPLGLAEELKNFR